MQAAAGLLERLREDVAAQAAFVADHMGRIVAFDVAPHLPPAALSEVTAKQLGKAESMLQHVGERTAGIVWEIGVGQSIYVTALGDGLAVALLFDAPEVEATKVHGAVSRLREELTEAFVSTD